ncbi:tail assembly chaperone [Gordonia phage Lozinak]|uniref:Tail assembly chaperone n=5 Tax=Smoothievirus TaxID=1982557 RepID=A0A2D1GFN7_9CAUD|nr:tail assembly chaperone [Gordonia phage Smoothie]YP_009273079.1 tail assembly chaperone [Gordonia phage ClubL]YP_009276157.1 tail assembly chaperone [Gordonia phage Bachita]YP_009281200.1 tail assembly chaperone [Gordonia phage Cucurbita]ATN90671.1 tail assembly chaperone [Gordonia phage Lozinak]AUE23614.1 tail assembly chaperone [Gordonia phage Toniann]QAU06910.1 tail assembly chaperone [Gordonia phage Aphelion]QKY79622.1 tail assembly chaperone [Gordonia Phage Engineer]QYC53530.1 tail 
MADEAANEPTAVDDVETDAQKPAEEQKTSRFWTLFSEVMGEYTPQDPYPFDGFGPDNIIEISAPDTADRALAIVNLCDIHGDVDVKDVQPYMKALLGDEAFELIWPKFLGPFPVQVSLRFAQELTEHFFGGQMDAIKASAAGLPGGIVGLVEIIEAYGWAIEGDLMDRGFTLHEFMRGDRPWPLLYRFITGLPSHTRYKSAIFTNEELAEDLVKAQKLVEQLERDRMLESGIAPPDEEEGADDPRTSPTSFVGWTREADLLAQLNDSVKVLNSTLIGVNLPKGKRPPTVRPTPRPVSAVEAVRRRVDRDEAKQALKDLGF